jgi:universal stress protein E
MRFLVLKNILVATDLADPADSAILTASQLAGAAGASLHVACVLTSSGGDRGEMLHARAREELAAILVRAGVRVNDATIHLLSGDPASAIGSLGGRIRADVFVLGPHRERGSRPRGLGGTALAVVTDSSSPCLIVSTPLRLPLSHVLVPVDLSDTARGALLVGLSWASALRAPALQAAERRDVRLTALHVQPTSSTTPAPFVEKELAFLREEGGTWAGVSVHGETVADADVTRGIASFAASHGPDLVVLGTRGLGLDPVGRLGSVAASVSQSIELPTLLVPPAVWMAHATKSSGDT